MTQDQAGQKAAVQEFWDRESCGERYAVGEGALFYESQANERYALEPWIKPFARFNEGKGKRVLELGVGMGADYLEWLKSGGHAIGIDFTPRAVGHTARRCALAGRRSLLAVADAELLPFAEGTFDLVYSWGVAHHSPDTAAVFREIARILRPGGVARIAIYHYPSWGSFLIWARAALLQGRLFESVRSVVANNLESPGTKLFTLREARELCRPFSRILDLRSQLGLGDLMSMKPSAKYSDPLSRLIFKVYPRWLIRRLGHRWGGYLLIECEK